MTDRSRFLSEEELRFQGAKLRDFLDRGGSVARWFMSKSFTRLE